MSSVRVVEKLASSHGHIKLTCVVMMMQVPVLFLITHVAIFVGPRSWPLCDFLISYDFQRCLLLTRLCLLIWEVVMMLVVMVMQVHDVHRQLFPILMRRLLHVGRLSVSPVLLRPRGVAAILRMSDKPPRRGRSKEGTDNLATLMIDCPIPAVPNDGAQRSLLYFNGQPCA